jgi:hypothetical protein
MEQYMAFSVYLGIIPLNEDSQEKEEKEGDEMKDKIFFLH